MARLAGSALTLSNLCGDEFQVQLPDSIVAAATDVVALAVEQHPGTLGVAAEPWELQDPCDPSSHVPTLPMAALGAALLAGSWQRGEPLLIVYVAAQGVEGAPGRTRSVATLEGGDV